MMAGALVNERDIGHGLFTPDVPIPESVPEGEAVIFYSPLPMALSTRAEMMTRYDNDILDGIETCIQRIHVTGGTSAALIDSIRKHRPFTLRLSVGPRIRRISFAACSKIPTKTFAISISPV